MAPLFFCFFLWGGGGARGAWGGARGLEWQEGQAEAS